MVARREAEELVARREAEELVARREAEELVARRAVEEVARREAEELVARREAEELTKNLTEESWSIINVSSSEDGSRVTIRLKLDEEQPGLIGDTVVEDEGVL